jgi:RNA polymerase sigma-70 factor (ECF subfamily)
MQQVVTWCTLDLEVATSGSMHDAERALQNPSASLAIPISFFRSRFLAGARIKDLGTLMDKTPSDPTDPMEALRGGDSQALAMLFDRYRAQLRRMVELRLDPRLRGRLDASDVLQEAFLDVARDLNAYLADPKLPPLLWLRLHVGRQLTTLHRRHLGTRMRDAGQEISLFQGALPQASSAALASMLLGQHTSPTQAAQRAERMLRVPESLNSLDPIDREMLALRHFE